MSVNLDTYRRITKFMRQLADSEHFPEHERDYWIEVCTQPEFVEQMFVHIAKYYDSRDEGMCKLLNIIDSHLAKEMK